MVGSKVIRLYRLPKSRVNNKYCLLPYSSRTFSYYEYYIPNYPWNIKY